MAELDQVQANQAQPESTDEESKGPSEQTLTQQKQKKKVQQARKMEQAVKEDREQKLATKMSNLRVGQEDLRLMNEIQIQVLERLIQIPGHFFKYDATLGKNLLIKEGLFLCIDKVVTEEQREQYVIHVVDPAGQLSFCRAPIISSSLIQFSTVDQLLMWVGTQRSDGSIPAWVFYLINESDVQPM